MKIFSKILSVLFILVFCNVFVFGEETQHTLRDVYVYTIMNKNYKDVNADIVSFFGSRSTESVIPEIPYGYLREKNPQSHYFIKIYPAYKDTNIFIVSDEKYNKETNPMTAAFKALSYKYTNLLDKEAVGEYQEDFVYYVRSGYLKEFFVLPDYLTGVKKGVTKVTDTVKKKQKKQVALPYKNDDTPIDLKCIDENIYKDTENQLTIKEREYRLQFKANKYTHAFEYIIYNNGSDALTVNKVKGESVADIAELEAKTLTDLDRIDALSWAAIFPPVLVATCGTSVLLKAPAYYRNVRVAEEVAKYAKSFPENYKIPAKSHIRFTTIQYKENRKPLNIKFTRDNSSFNVAL